MCHIHAREHKKGYKARHRQMAKEGKACKPKRRGRKAGTGQMECR